CTAGGLRQPHRATSHLLAAGLGRPLVLGGRRSLSRDRLRRGGSENRPGGRGARARRRRFPSFPGGGGSPPGLGPRPGWVCRAGGGWAGGWGGDPRQGRRPTSGPVSALLGVSSSSPSTGHHRVEHEHPPLRTFSEPFPAKRAAASGLTVDSISSAIWANT